MALFETHRRLRAALVALGIAGVAALAAEALARRIVHADARWVSDASAAPLAPVAIVLGAGIREGRLSAILEDRLATAVELYRAGRVKKLLLSGDHGRRDYDEPAAMAAYVEARGIPPADVFLDHAGFDTYATFYRARHVFGVREALVVTQEFHLPRALYYARRLEIAATGVRADRRRYARSRWYAVRELGASLKAVLVADLLKPLPRYVGPPIPIAGDGTVTHDRKSAPANK